MATRLRMVRKRSLESLRTVLLQKFASEQPLTTTTAPSARIGLPNARRGLGRAHNKTKVESAKNKEFLPSWESDAFRIDMIIFLKFEMRRCICCY